MHDELRPKKCGQDSANKNALRIHPSEPMREGPFAIAIPGNPAEPAEMHCRTGALEAHACSVKHEQKRGSKDLAFVFSAEGSVLAGVLDGFGPIGDSMPMELCRQIYGGWMLQDCRADSAGAVLSLLENAATLAAGIAFASLRARFRLKPDFKSSEKISRLCRQIGGGTTATIISVLPDGRYFMAGLGDSAGFIKMGGGAVARQLPTDAFPEGLPQDCPLFPKQSQHDKMVYFQIRNILTSSVGIDGVDGQACTAEGALTPGSMAILVSDGITKNLDILLGEKGEVVGCGGCEDLLQMSRGISSSDGVARAIIRESKARAISGPGLVERGERRILIPADDDMTALVISLSGQSTSVP